MTFKIKDKKPFGEKHRLRRKAQSMKSLEESKRRLEESKQRLQKSRKWQQEFLDRQPWYQRILALETDAPCEFYAEAAWRSAIFVQRLVDADQMSDRWRVRDAQGKRFLVRWVRSQGDQEAFPWVGQPKSEQQLEFEQKHLKRTGQPLPALKEIFPDPAPVSEPAQ